MPRHATLFSAPRSRPLRSVTLRIIFSIGMLILPLVTAATHNRASRGITQSAATQTFQQSRASQNTAKTGQKTQVLKQGEPVEDELAGEQAHSYQLTLNAAQYLHVVVEQRGIDVVVSLFGPDGKKLVEVDSPNGTQGPEPLSWITEAAGTYRLEIRSLEKDAAAGRYEVRLVELRVATAGDRDLAEALKLDKESDSLSSQGKYNEAILLSERTLEIRQRVLNSDHREVALSLSNLATLYYHIGSYKEAEPLFQRALVVSEKAFGPEHPQVATSLDNLAALYLVKGNYMEAEARFRRALAIREKTLGPDHPEVATSLNNLSAMYYNKKDYKESEPLLQRALAIEEKAFGRGHPGTATTLTNLGELYRAKGDFEEAEPKLQRALDIREKALGPDHPDVANSLNILALLYKEKGDYAKAEPPYLRAVAIWEKALGLEHPNVAISLNNLAALYLAKGDFAKAESNHLRALAIDEKVFGHDHPEVATSLNNLAVLYKGKGDYPKAASYFQRTAMILEKAFGPDHPNLAVSLNNLAELYREKGEYAMAEPLHQRAVAILEKTLGPEHPDTIAALSNLAGLYVDKGDYTKAEPLLERVITMDERTFGRDHPRVTAALAKLASLYKNRGSKRDEAKAGPLLQRALAINEKALGPDHPELAASLNNLAGWYSAKRDYAEAESLYRRALAIVERQFGAEHPKYAISLGNIAVLYYRKGDFAQAEPLFHGALAILEKTLGPIHPIVTDTLDGLASLSLAKNDVRRAVTFLNRATKASEQNISSVIGVGSEREKLAYMALFSNQTNFALALNARSGASDQRAIELAFTILLQRKGRVLDAMMNNIAQARRRAVESGNQEDQKLFDDLLDAYSRLSALTHKDPYLAGSVSLQSQLDEAKKQVEEQEAKVSARFPQVRAQLQPVTLEAIQSLIPKQTALIEYALYAPFDLQTKNWGAPRYAAYVLTSQGPPHWIDLGKAKGIDQTIKELRKSLSDPGHNYNRQFARSLDEQVMRKVRALTGGAKRLLISPEGQLNMIPFAGLVDEQRHFLVEKYSITYLTSGRDLLLRFHEQSKEAPLVLADPEFGEQPNSGSQAAQHLGRPLAAEQNGNASKNPFGPFVPLPDTKKHAEEIKALWPQARILTGAEATKVALKKARAPLIMHLGTHGFFLQDIGGRPLDPRDLNLVGTDPATMSAPGFDRWMALAENPLLRSGLALAGANLRRSGDDDGLLTAQEVAGLDLWGTKLVTLAACETGVGQVKNGEGVYGLRRALVLAGAESQLMSLWKVRDDATTDLMKDYYRALQQGQGRGEALRRAQQQMLRDPYRNHPYYWAAFILSGEWANLEGKR